MSLVEWSNACCHCVIYILSFGNRYEKRPLLNFRFQEHIYLSFLFIVLSYFRNNMLLILISRSLIINFMFFSGALDNLKIHDGELIVRDVFFGYHMDLEYNVPVSYIHTYYHYRFGVNVPVCGKWTIFSSGHRIQVSLSYTSSEFMLNLFIF